MTLHRLRTGAFELDSQIAEESGVPPIAMAFEEAVGFLEGKEIQYQCAQRRRFADLLVEDACIGGCEDTVGTVC